MDSSLNQYFDQIYLINLPRRQDKLIKVLWQLNKYNIKVRLIEAFDGRHPKHYFAQKILSPGAYGYVLTWERIIENAKLNRYKKILIFDDDIVLCKDFNKLFTNWIKDLKNNLNLKNNNNNNNLNPKVILLGATQHTERPILINNFNGYYPKIIDGSFATGIDCSIYDDLLNLLSTHNKIVDSDVLRTIYRKFPGECFVAYPNLVMADVTHSDIRSSRSQEVLSKKVGWELDFYNWPNISPLVSIIVSCYQSESTIARCLSSIINQTYRPIELIITDDGSTDNTWSEICGILNKLEFSKFSKDLKVKLFKHGKNKGSYVARNNGLRHATGDFITFQDADDISLNYRISTQVSQLLLRRVKFVTCLILRTHLTFLPEDPIELENRIRATRIHKTKYCCRSKVGLVTTLFRKETIKQLGYYKEWKWGADAEYVRRLFPRLDPNHKMMNFLNETEYIPKLYYRVPEIMYLSYEMTHKNLTTQRMKSLNL